MDVRKCKTKFDVWLICVVHTITYNVKLTLVLVVNEKEEGVLAFKIPLWIGAGTRMRTQYLPAHCPMI